MAFSRANPSLFLALFFLLALAASAYAVSISTTGAGDIGGCGNGLCESTESILSCPEDCTGRGAKSSYCGDYICGEGENTFNCPQDCGSPATCGDNECIYDEDRYTCPLDCGVPLECGNRVCDAKEHVYNCPLDCGYAESCGDGVCSGKENSYNCLADCRRSQAKCGDAVCDEREGPYNCPLDCGAPATCGNNTCDPPHETAFNCPGDCGLPPACGNAVCDTFENTYNCATDCQKTLPGKGFADAPLVSEEEFDRRYTPTNPMDFFKLKVRSGQTLTATAVCEPLYWGPTYYAEPAIAIYSEAEQILARDAGQLQAKDDRIELTVSWTVNAESDDYILFVGVGPDKQMLRRFQCTTRFDVSDKFDAGSGRDAGDDFDSALPVSPGMHPDNHLTGGVEGSDERDVYRLNLRRGERLQVRVLPSLQAAMTLTFYNASGLPLRTQATQSPSAVVNEVVATQNYSPLFIEVARVVNGPYALEITIEQVDLCNYVACEPGTTCVDGKCVLPPGSEPAPPSPQPGAVEPGAEPRRPSLLDQILAFIAGLFGL